MWCMWKYMCVFFLLALFVVIIVVVIIAGLSANPCFLHYFLCRCGKYSRRKEKKTITLLFGCIQKEKMLKRKWYICFYIRTKRTRFRPEEKKNRMATMTITLYFPVIFWCYLSCVAIDHIHFGMMHEIRTHVQRQQSRSLHPPCDYHRPR